MASRQRTFDLIPTSLVDVISRPPMTSKAAKKAHQLATRGPRVSRAEQRKRDAEEIAKQKKEYEREKAASKAKAVREKKAAKEQADRDLRKKNGLPEPSRFVRASQPTISRFVKSGNKRTWLDLEAHAEESDATTIADDDSFESMKAIAQPQPKRMKTDDESENEYGDFPSFSQSELGAVLEEAESPVKPDIRRRGHAIAKSTEVRWREEPKSHTTIFKDNPDESMLEDMDRLDEMVATQLLQEAAQAAARQQKLSAAQNCRPKSTQDEIDAANATLRDVKKEGLVSAPRPPMSTQEIVDAADAILQDAEKKGIILTPRTPKSTQGTLDAADAILSKYRRKGYSSPPLKSIPKVITEEAEEPCPKSTKEIFDAADAILNKYQGETCLSRPLSTTQNVIKGEEKELVSSALSSKPSQQKAVDKAEASLRDSRTPRDPPPSSKAPGLPQKFLDALQVVVKDLGASTSPSKVTESPNSTQELLGAMLDAIEEPNSLPSKSPIGPTEGLRVSEMAAKAEQDSLVASKRQPLPAFSRSRLALTFELDQSSPKSAAKSRPALQEQSVNIPRPPLPLPFKGRRGRSFAPSPHKLQSLPGLLSHTSANQQNLPSSTQAFLENNMDEFFPSPSQEVRELLDDIIDLPSNTQIARELDPDPSLPLNTLPEDCFANLMCTQDLVLSSQDILEIPTPCPPTSKPQKTAQPTSTLIPVPLKMTKQPRRRFFEEKDDDLVHAAVLASKADAANEQQCKALKPSRLPVVKTEQKTRAKNIPRESKRPLTRTVSNVTDYGEDEFNDCEDELMALC